MRLKMEIEWQTIAFFVGYEQNARTFITIEFELNIDADKHDYIANECRVRIPLNWSIQQTHFNSIANE